MHAIILGGAHRSLHPMRTEQKVAKTSDDKMTRTPGMPFGDMSVALEAKALMHPFSFEQNFPGPLFWLMKVSTSAAVMPVQPERTLDLA